jgi:hypothetical protein
MVGVEEQCQSPASKTGGRAPTRLTSRSKEPTPSSNQIVSGFMSWPPAQIGRQWITCVSPAEFRRIPSMTKWSARKHVHRQRDSVVRTPSLSRCYISRILASPLTAPPAISASLEVVVRTTARVVSIGFHKNSSTPSTAISLAEQSSMTFKTLGTEVNRCRPFRRRRQRFLGFAQNRPLRVRTVAQARLSFS